MMNVLVVDDNVSLVKALVAFLKQEGHEPLSSGTVKEALDLIKRHGFDLVITDLKLPDGSGIEIAKAARERENPAEVILMTAYGSVETAVAAMKMGALDYLIKPVPLEDFAFRLARVAKIRTLVQQAETLQRANEILLETSGLTSPLDEIIGKSEAILKVKDLIKKSAGFPSTVLFTGETGVGKEMAARAIHSLSPWASGPFVRVNCASIPDTLFESELFGHEKGAFTDARERRIGRFEAARNGTLFLDEVGEVPLPLQSKLLRALQDKEIVRVGSSQPIVVETRIVAATNRRLEEMAEGGQFRSDLLYRLAVIRIEIPALRERREDIPAIAERMLRRFRAEFGKPEMRFSKEALQLLMNQEWRGNIRELKNAIERAVVLADDPVIGVEGFSFPEIPAGAGTSSPSVDRGQGGLIEVLADVEKKMIQSALEKTGGVKARAAEELKIPRTNLLYRMKRLGLLNEEDPEKG